MAHQESVIGLLYSIKDEIKLEITEYEWSKEYKLNYFDFAVSFSFDCQNFIGRGVDENENLALEKAASEAVERLICYSHKIDSVGLSISMFAPSRENTYDCDNHAKNELLERYFLNEHISKNINFLRYDHISSDLISNFLVNNTEINIQFLKMRTPINQFGTVCLLSCGLFRSVGFSYSNQEINAIEKSFIEALPNLVWVIKNNVLDAEKPWHLKDEFIKQVEMLTVSRDDQDQSVIQELVLRKIDIHLDSISFLKDSFIKVSKYVIKNQSEFV